jgi:hypothetical protein
LYTTNLTFWLAGTLTFLFGYKWNSIDDYCRDNDLALPVFTEDQIDVLLAEKSAVQAGRFELSSYNTDSEYEDALKRALWFCRWKTWYSHRSTQQHRALVDTLQKQRLLRFGSLMRRQPFGLVIHGGPGTGKSKAAYELAKRLMDLAGTPLYANELIVLNEADEYQSEYRSNHKVVIFDDVGSTKISIEAKDPYRKVIDFINNVPRCALNPHLELKGNVQIRPEIVIMTSNSLDSLPQSQVEPGAAYRRFKVKLTMPKRETYYFVEQVPSSLPSGLSKMTAMTFNGLESDHTLHTIDSVMDIIGPQYLQHLEEQDSYMSSCVLPQAPTSVRTPWVRFQERFFKPSRTTKIVAQSGLYERDCDDPTEVKFSWEWPFIKRRPAQIVAQPLRQPWYYGPPLDEDSETEGCFKRCVNAIRNFNLDKFKIYTGLPVPDEDQFEPQSGLVDIILDEHDLESEITQMFDIITLETGDDSVVSMASDDAVCERTYTIGPNLIKSKHDERYVDELFQRISKAYVAGKHHLFFDLKWDLSTLKLMRSVVVAMFLKSTFTLSDGGIQNKVANYSQNSPSGFCIDNRRSVQGELFLQYYLLLWQKALGLTLVDRHDNEEETFTNVVIDHILEVHPQYRLFAREYTFDNKGKTHRGDLIFVSLDAQAFLVVEVKFGPPGMGPKQARILASNYQSLMAKQGVKTLTIPCVAYGRDKESLSVHALDDEHKKYL